MGRGRGARQGATPTTAHHLHMHRTPGAGSRAVLRQPVTIGARTPAGPATATPKAKTKAKGMKPLSKADKAMVSKAEKAKKPTKKQREVKQAMAARQALQRAAGRNKRRLNG